MEHNRTLEITVLSAKDLKDVNVFSKMDVYVVASLSGNPKAKQKTGVDHDGGQNPTWNFPMKFFIDSSSVSQTLVFKLKCSQILGDKDLGEVNVSVKELLDGYKSTVPQFVNYQVRMSSGKPKGMLNFSYKFVAVDEKIAKFGKGNEPVVAYSVAGAGTSSGYPDPRMGSFPVQYPPPHPSGVYAYPPPPPSVGYAYPPPPPSVGYAYPPPPSVGYAYPPPPPPQGYGYHQAGYGYPPQGYGYPPVQQQKQVQGKKKFGLGLGAGLLGGAIGGLLLGEMVSDAVDSGGGGFDDPGFGDMGFC